MSSSSINLEDYQYPLKGAKPVDFKKEEVFIVSMEEYALTTATSQLPILGTSVAASCVIVALYNDEGKIAILSHIDEFARTESINQMIQLMPSEGTVAHVYGGSVESVDLCTRIITALEENNICINNADILRKDHMTDSASLAIDARTGTIYSPVEPHHMKITPEFKKRHARPAREYDHPLIESFNALKITSDEKNQQSAHVKLNLLSHPKGKSQAAESQPPHSEQEFKRKIDN
ncbi:MAG: hypothetical protein ACYCQI_02910 [Gammaproteobacteria bacterium]